MLSGVADEVLLILPKNIRSWGKRGRTFKKRMKVTKRAGQMAVQMKSE